MLILEVGPVEGPEWEVDVKVAVEGDDKAGVTEASSHVMEFLWGGRVCAEAVCIQGDIHQHDGASGSRGRDNKERGRNSINKRDMRKKGENCYSSGGRDRGRNEDRSRRGGGRMVEFDGHDSDGGSFSKRRMVERRLKGGAFYSY